MDLFNLPNTTIVNRVIPKNAFDSYTNKKQKKLFTDIISRITWTHKIAKDTVNLEGKDIKEIQIFKVELKVKDSIQPVLDIIDKAIPYHIIFIIESENMICLSTSSKHPHPIDENNAVIDWTFKTEWFTLSENKFDIRLKESIDRAYQDFCLQVSNIPFSVRMLLPDLIEYRKKVNSLEKDIIRLRSAINSSQQFNRKVVLNLELKDAERKLSELIEKYI